MLLDPEQKIARPRQIYLGQETRPYQPIEDRLPAEPAAARIANQPAHGKAKA
jgi:citrate synthase